MKDCTLGFLVIFCFPPNDRKICRNCKCGQEEHDVLLSTEEDRKVGRLFEDTKYTTLIAKLKSDGIPMYKRNVMILTNPVAAKKNVSINTVTYEWAPPVQNQALVSTGGRRRREEAFVVLVVGTRLRN